MQSFVVGFGASLLMAYLLTRLFLQLVKLSFRGTARITVAYVLAGIGGVTLVAWMLSRGGPLNWLHGAVAMLPVLAVCLAMDLLVNRYRVRIPGFGTMADN